MRLDHLLSKEPLFGRLFWFVLMFCGVLFLFCVGWLCALLGSEAPAFVSLVFLVGRWKAGFSGLLVVCWLFENCIVDASIFVVFERFVFLFVSYLVWSVDALAPRADEGRCNLR